MVFLAFMVASFFLLLLFLFTILALHTQLLWLQRILPLLSGPTSWILRPYEMPSFCLYFSECHTSSPPLILSPQIWRLLSMRFAHVTEWYNLNIQENTRNTLAILHPTPTHIYLSTLVFNLWSNFINRSHICYFTDSLKFICNPQISTQRHHYGHSWACAEEPKIWVVWSTCSPLRSNNATLPSCFSSHAVNKCLFGSLFNYHLFCIFTSFCWWFCCLQWLQA